jgi:hypothetical protein
LAPAATDEEAAAAQALFLALRSFRHVVLFEDESGLAAIGMTLHRFLMRGALDVGPIPLRHGWGRAMRQKGDHSKGCHAKHKSMGTQRWVSKGFQAEV